MLHSFKKYGSLFKFHVVNGEDTIQRCHTRGFFYEEEELLDLKLSVPNKSIIVDVGANVGNHAVFFSKVYKANKVVLFEPNPTAIECLRKNIELNDLDSVCDLRHLGLALGAKEGKADICHPEHLSGNLGAASIRPSDFGSVNVCPADQLLVDIEYIDLIKIDVEGFELEVLAGFNTLIHKFKPVIYVEVSDENLGAFNDWLKFNSYRIDRTHSRHRGLKNLLCFSC